SRAEVTEVTWERAVQSRPVTRAPSGNVLLRAVSTAEPPPSVGDVLVRTEDALVEVNASVQITQEVVLVKEDGRWLVDLAASDELNARAAAEVFLEAVASEASGGGGPRAVRTGRSSMPMLKALLVAEAKDYQVATADIEGERARVTLACDLPVNLVLRAQRLGPGWSVDFSRPVLATDPTEPNPLEAAVAEMDKTTCTEQLRQLGRAFTMYAAASDDMLPQADEWVEKLRPFLPLGISLHCPTDSAAGVSYALNANLRGKRRREVADPAQTPLVYASTLRGDNPAGTGEGWPTPSRHPDGNLVLYLDGSVRVTQTPPNFVVRAAEPGSVPTHPRAIPRRIPGRAP
ncbi:MAG: hypothetical protein JW990_02000, partial [Thermoleophilia bacterium]|nr:hypothetical protein [Thermoleophilia bacterium]